MSSDSLGTIDKDESIVEARGKEKEDLGEEGEKRKMKRQHRKE